MISRAPTTSIKQPKTPQELAEPTLEERIAAITEAAEGNLEQVDPECRQDYIKKATWEDAEKSRVGPDNRTHN